MHAIVTNNEPSILPDRTVADLIIQHPELREKLEHLGIDYCCGGTRPLGEAVKASGQEWPDFLAALGHNNGANAECDAHTDWNKATLSALAGHILEKHHKFTKEQLSRLDALLGRVKKAHGVHHGDMLEHLWCIFNVLHQELDSHLMKEEHILFPAIKAIDAFMAGTAGKPVIECGSIANPIRQLENEHKSAGDALVEMRRITCNYRLPADACETFKALYDGLQALEADLHEHIHLENNILFPKSVAQEANMIKGTNAT